MTYFQVWALTMISVVIGWSLVMIAVYVVLKWSKKDD